MMGHRQVEQAALFYELSLERHIPAEHLLRSFGRSRTDDPDADCRLLLWHPLGATPL